MILLYTHTYLVSYLFCMLHYNVAFPVNLVHSDVILGSLQAVVAHANTDTPCLYL